jgi:hypothetical protein
MIFEFYFENLSIKSKFDCNLTRRKITLNKDLFTFEIFRLITLRIRNIAKKF